MKKALDGRCHRATTAPRPISHPIRVSTLAGPSPAWLLATTPSMPSVCRANSTVPAARAPLLPRRQARAMPSQIAISAAHSRTARVAAPASR